VAILGLIAVAACQSPKPSPSTISPQGSESASPTEPSRPPSTPLARVTPNPSPNLDQAERVIKTLGGIIPTNVTAKVSTEQVVPNLDWQMVTIGEWRVAWDSGGQVGNVFHHPPAGMPANKLTAAKAVAAAKTFLQKLGVAAPAGVTPTTEQMPDSYWLVTWPRIDQGVPVGGDYIMVSVLGDGRFFEYARVWRPLGAKPNLQIDIETAIQDIDGCGIGPSGQVCKPSYEWYSPTDLNAPGDPNAPLRLGWLIKMGDTPAWVVDAETGEVLPIP
jgi:hypothetical protein